MTAEQTRTDCHVVVAVGAENQLAPLLSLGCRLAAARHGHVTVLTVTRDGERPAWLVTPERCGQVPVQLMVQRSAEPAAGILAAVRNESVDLLLLGWRGRPGRGRYLVGRTLDPLVQNAPCDVIVAVLDKPSLIEPQAVERVLVPVSGGPNASLALDLALMLAPEARVTALHVALERQGRIGLSLSRERLQEALSSRTDESRIQGEVVQAATVHAGILLEASKRYDLMLIGASQESYLDRMLFGNIPQVVATQSPIPALITRRYTRSMRVGSWLRQTAWSFFHLLPTLELGQQIEVYKSIRKGAEPKADFFVMIGLSAAIAALGLLQNSPAVIIGAMLVAPLMAAIFGLSLGVVRGDPRLLRRAAGATVRGVLLAIAIAAVLARIIPAATPRSEVMARAQPSLLDLGVALASGAAGAYALSRKDVSASLPGVAIAAALVPPLATVGIGLALGQGRVAGGAALLFLTNLVAIVAAGGLVFLWLGFRPSHNRPRGIQVFQGGMLGTLLLLVAVTIPLGLLTAQSVREAVVQRALERAIRDEVATLQGLELVEWTQLPAEDGSDVLRLEVWVRSPRSVTHAEVLELQEKVANHLQRPVALWLSVIPTTRLDPLLPPTPTLPLLPGGSPAAAPTPTPAPTNG